jgi:NAD(P)H-hydrate epimerase
VPHAASIVAAHLAECTYLPLLCEDGHISARSIPVLMGEAEAYPALLFGPGLGRSEDTGELLRSLVTQYHGTLVIDADGLNALCGCTDILTQAAGRIILTPHVHEMARLSGLDAEAIRRDPGGSAAVFAETHGVTVVLKGSVTHIAGGGALYANDRPNSGLAKGGSGDVLAGLIAGLAAQGAEPLHAAAAGVFVHSLAGAMAAERLGERGMLPSDTAAMIPLALKALEK